MSTLQHLKLLLASSLILFSTTAISENNTKITPENSCLGCHDAVGRSINPLQPNLDELPQSYLVSQLLAFQDSTRQHPKMNKQALNLNNNEILELAIFFSKRPFDGNTKTHKNRHIGLSKYNTCIGCHGVNGEGRGNYPRLAGLTPAYINKQLKDYKNKQRNHQLMGSIAQVLTAQDIAELATYIGSL